jgi:amidase
MLTNDEYEQYDAVGLAALVQSGETSAAELLECAIAQAEKLNPALNAVIVKDYESARAVASAQAVQKPAGLLAGVPFLMKDICAVKGLPQTRSSRLFADDIAKSDSRVTERFRSGGLVLFGKTNTPELCVTITTESVINGPCKNPLAPDYSTGGSSGGAAAAVAAGIVPAAHGSDGGGSIRAPASCCGLVGLKPSRGLTVIEDDISSSWGGFSVNHVLTRTVRDSAAFLDLLRLRAAQLFPIPEYKQSYFHTHATHPGRLRVAVQRAHPAGFPVHDDCLAAVDKTVSLCSAQGFIMEDLAPPVDYKAITHAMITVINTHVAQVVVPQLDVRKVSLADAPLEEATRRMSAAGIKVSAIDYIKALDILKHAERQMAAFHQRYDLILSPVLAMPPAELGWLDMAGDDMKIYAQRFASYGGFAALFNGTGQPSIALPLHVNNVGLPIGVMFSASWGQDHQLLQVADLLLNESERQ